MASEESQAPPDKVRLLAAIESSRKRLDHLIWRLSAYELIGVRDGAGWCVLDHLSHVTAWEQSMVALFAGRPRHEGLGVPEDLYLAHDEEAINAAIHTAAAGQSLVEALSAHRRARAAMDGALALLTDDDLLRSYSHFLPDEPGRDDGSPIVWRITGNTSEHIDEHLGWIEALFERR